VKIVLPESDVHASHHDLTAAQANVAAGGTQRT
jgi:hypothetical protein